VPGPSGADQDRPAIHLVRLQAVGPDRGDGLGYLDEQPGQVRQPRQRQPGEIGPVLEAVRRGVEVGPGVGHHRDPSDVELGALGVGLPRRGPAQVVGDLGRRQPRVRDHPVVDLMTQLDQHPPILAPKIAVIMM
jgi:hypothetical protein